MRMITAPSDDNKRDPLSRIGRLLINGPRNWLLYWLLMALSVGLIGHLWQHETWGLSGAGGIVFATLALLVRRPILSHSKRSRSAGERKRIE